MQVSDTKTCEQKIRNFAPAPSVPALQSVNFFPKLSTQGNLSEPKQTQKNPRVCGDKRDTPCARATRLRRLCSPRILPPLSRIHFAGYPAQAPGGISDFFMCFRKTKTDCSRSLKSSCSNDGSAQVTHPTNKKWTSVWMSVFVGGDKRDTPYGRATRLRRLCSPRILPPRAAEAPAPRYLDQRKKTSFRMSFPLVEISGIEPLTS